MLNTEDQLIKDLSVVELLSLIRKKTDNTDGKLVLTLAMLAEASRATYTSIRYCEQHGLISMHPTSNNAYVFELTGKGLKYLNTSREAFT